MQVQILRRYRLGKGSTNGIVGYMNRLGIQDISVVRNDLGTTNAPLVIRWGCTSAAPGAQYIINKPEGIHTVNTKDSFRRKLQDAGVSVPPSYFNKEDAAAAISAGKKLIGRKSHHAQGRKAKVINNITDLRNDMQSNYWSEIIKKDREFRVYCFFGKVIAVAEKVPDDINQLLWNRAQGHAVFNNVRWSEWPIAVVKEALKVHQLSGCDFEGVDVMSKEGVPYILESNSAPSLTTEYRKECFAKAFASVIKYVEEHNEKPAHATFNSTGRRYQDFIHPSIVS